MRSNRFNNLNSYKSPSKGKKLIITNDEQLSINTT
jgi:hypothetical protein